jgi:hypothetical protein
MDMYNSGGGDMFGGSGGVGGSFGASPDIDYGMGIYEQRLRGNSFQQVNDQRLRAGSFQLYPQQQQQQQQQVHVRVRLCGCVVVWLCGCVVV